MQNQPNILFIIADQWTARVANGRQSGDALPTTPAIARLAREGVSFSNASTPFPVCTPARASLFSGNMPCHTRVIGNTGEQPPGKITPVETPRLGDLLRAAGYDTGYFGKTHAAGLTSGFDDLGEYVYAGPGYLACGSLWDPLFTRDAIRFIERDRSRPFFGVLSLINPHDICRVPPGIPFENASIADLTDSFHWSDAYSRGRRLPPIPSSLEIPALDWMPPTHGSVPDWTVDRWRRQLGVYQLLIENVDWQIGLVLDALERSGKANDTIVIFTSDHGDHSGAHGLVGKGTFYEESVQVPLIVKVPGRKNRAGALVDTPVSLVDLLPTLAAFGRAPVLGSCDGLDLSPLLDDASAAATWPRDYVVSEIVGGCMVRFDRYKYIRIQEHEGLFDLVNDPLESRNLATAGACRNEVLDAARSRLAEYHMKTGSDIQTNCRWQTQYF